MDRRRARRVLARPAVVKCGRADALAYGLLLLVALFMAGLLLTLVVAVVEWEWPMRLLLATAGIAAVGGGVAWSAVALLRRRPWAQPAVTVVYAVASVLFVGLTVLPFVGPPWKGDGTIYAVMGSAQMGALCVLGLVAAIRHPSDHCFGPRPPGWVRDPTSRALAWRYWDGERWGDSVAGGA